MSILESVLTSLTNEKITCAHCGGSGSCKTDDGKSCEKCVDFNCLNKDSEPRGIVCSVCEGTGVADLKSGVIRKRTPSALAFIVVVLSFYIISLSLENDNLENILPVCSSLIAGVIGYYFSGKDNYSNN